MAFRTVRHLMSTSQPEADIRVSEVRRDPLILRVAVITEGAELILVGVFVTAYAFRIQTADLLGFQVTAAALQRLMRPFHL